jgi:hypothetical protein
MHTTHSVDCVSRELDRATCAPVCTHQHTQQSKAERLQPLFQALDVQALHLDASMILRYCAATDALHLAPKR